MAHHSPYPLSSEARSSITQVAGIEVGHFTDPRRPTGCTVIIARDGAVAGVDVRGAAPGTRETDLLHPSNLVDRVHAITLSGGSAWGLDAAGGVMQWLEQQGIGLPVHYGLVPIVPAAVLFDLPVGDHTIRPDAAAGYAACVAASRNPPAEGNVGAGAGALIGKLYGIERAMKGGIGSASITLDGITVGAIVACNALGDVVDPTNGHVLAGTRVAADSLSLLNSRSAILAGAQYQSGAHHVRWRHGVCHGYGPVWPNGRHDGAVHSGSRSDRAGRGAGHTGGQGRHPGHDHLARRL